MSTLPTGSYDSVLQAFFGGMDDAEKQSIWNSFLTKEGLAVQPVDNSKLDDFIGFVEGASGYIKQNVLSPHEIEKRMALLDTMNFVLAVLNSLQDTVAVQSQSMIFLAKWQ